MFFLSTLKALRTNILSSMHRKKNLHAKESDFMVWCPSNDMAVKYPSGKTSTEVWFGSSLMGKLGGIKLKNE